ncbi:MAG: patatin-like phospholipase family protein [Dehalococcoidales bacterium]|nr:patatin-like phospholipase family protein [Dehalococcoidales bacterium]
MKKRKVGLALGGGAARGMAHNGVLQILEKSNIPIDMSAGTSAGAAVGAIYAQGKNTDELKKLAQSWDWKQRAQVIDLALPRSGFIAGHRIKKLLKSIIGDVNFDELKMPFACVATDVITGEEVVINQGSVLEAVRASISVPIIFSVVKYGGRYLVDGGLVNPVPVSVLKDMGADFIIAVNVAPRLNRMPGAVYLKESDSEGKSATKEPNIFSVIMKIFSINNSQVVEASLNGADVIIEPRMAGIGMADFSHAEECILEGGFSAIDAVLEIKRRLAV